MNIYEKLAAVQQELKAPKDKYNSFGEYRYRSLESINEAVKPLLAKNSATIILSDTLENIGGENVIKATARFLDLEAPPETRWNADGLTVQSGFLEVTAYAGITAEKKKLDRSQLYGVASSYARKYAMNGLLQIDDTKDADTEEYAKQTAQKPEPIVEPMPTSYTKITADTIAEITNLAEQAKVDLKAVLMKPLEDLTEQQAQALITSLKRRIEG